MDKKLTRDINNKMIAGVAAGIAKYLGHDVTLWRIGVVIAIVFSGFVPGILGYLFAWIVMPPEDNVYDVEYVINE